MIIFQVGGQKKFAHLTRFDADALTLHEHAGVQHHPLLAHATANALLQLHLYVSLVRRIAFQPASAPVRWQLSNRSWREYDFHVVQYVKFFFVHNFSKQSFCMCFHTDTLMMANLTN